jgi:hypothetical protein
MKSDNDKNDWKSKEPECMEYGLCGATGLYETLKYDECHCEIWIHYGNGEKKLIFTGDEEAARIYAKYCI